MSKWRKKPVVVEAYQLTEELAWKLITQEKPYPKGLKLACAKYHLNNRQLDGFVGTIVTIHGQETNVVIDDWVIEEPDGTHHYPCKPDIFEQTYEKV